MLNVYWTFWQSSHSIAEGTAFENE
uniref:Uncharacterized protein n=1 Tax=Anguilla anguilla TaxID=7936 RepID=A0A0E9THA2_ANGAN